MQQQKIVKLRKIEIRFSLPHHGNSFSVIKIEIRMLSENQFGPIMHHVGKTDTYSEIINLDLMNTLNNFVENEAKKNPRSARKFLF